MWKAPSPSLPGSEPRGYVLPPLAASFEGEFCGETERGREVEMEREGEGKGRGREGGEGGRGRKRGETLSLIFSHRVTQQSVYRLLLCNM